MVMCPLVCPPGSNARASHKVLVKLTTQTYQKDLNVGERLVEKKDTGKWGERGRRVRE